MPRISLGPFSLDLEPDWTLSTVIFAGPVIQEEPDDDRLPLAGEARRFQPNLVATMEGGLGKNVTPESYVERQIEGLRKAQVMRRESAPSKRVKLAGGAEGLLTEQVVVGPDGALVHQLQLVTIKDGVAYTLITSALDGPQYDKARERFQTILLSFI